MGRNLEPLNQYPPIFLLWEANDQVEGPFALDDIPEVTARYQDPPDRARYQGGNQWGPYPAFLDLLQRVQASEKLILRLQSLEIPIKNRDGISIGEAYQRIWEKEPPVEPEMKSPTEALEKIEPEPEPEEEALEPGSAKANTSHPNATAEQIEQLDQVLNYFDQYSDSIDIPDTATPGDMSELLKKLFSIQQDSQLAREGLENQCLELGRDVFEIMGLEDGADFDKIVPAVIGQGLKGEWDATNDLPPLIEKLYPGAQVKFLYSN